MIKVFEILGRWVPTFKVNKAGKEIYSYGVNNLLPNDNLVAINNSGVAKKAINKLKSYIEADGFSDKTLSETQVNKTQKADELLAEISSYAAYNKGFALFVKRDLPGKITEIEIACFECIRKTQSGDFSYNPLLGQQKDYKETSTTYHAAFLGLNPTPEQLQKIRQEKVGEKKEVNPYFGNAEILYVFERTADNPNYPVPDYVAGIEDIKTSSELQLLDLEAVKNAFMPSSVLVLPEADNITKDDHNKTESDYRDDILKSFTGNKKNREGESGRMKLMVVEVKTKEEADLVKLLNYDAKAIIDGSISKRDQIQRDVCRWIGVHPVLIGFSDAAVLGNTQAIANASKDLVDAVNPIQRMITRTFKMLYPGDWTISQYNFWNTIPTEVWSVLSEDEKRAVAGYQPLEKKAPEKSQQIIEAIATIPALVANEVLKSLTDDEKRELIGMPALTDEQRLKLNPAPTNGVFNK